jgi:site-specific recombinase XerD
MTENTHQHRDLDHVLADFEKYGGEVWSLEAETCCRQKRNTERLLPLLGVVDILSLQKLAYDRLENFMVALSKQEGPGTYHWASYSLRAFFRYAELTGVVDRPLQDWIPTVHKPRLGKVPYCLTEEQISQLLESLDLANLNDIRDHTVLSLLAAFGVRGIQVRKLKLPDVDWSNDRIHFPAVKRGNSVVMPLTIPVGNSLLRYLEEARPQSSYREVFLSCTKQKPLLEASSLTSMVAFRLKKAGIQLPEGVPVGTHLFRHSLASRLLKEDVPIKVIADLLGHRDLNTTMVYTKVDLRSLELVCQEWPEVET